MGYSYSDYEESRDFILRETGGFRPEILIVLGSGLGFVAESVKSPVILPYGVIPHFKTSTAPSHAGRFVFGQISGKKAAVMQGRLHTYEGYSSEDVAYPVRTARLLGADKMIITNAAGCVEKSWQAGDLMLISDHIRLMGQSPLAGENIEQFGPRFNDMSNVYDEGLREIAKQEAEQYAIRLREGVYMFFPGPQFETPAEIRAAAVLGAQAVGMSTVPEVTAASHAGMKILGISVLTNMAAGVSKNGLSSEEVEKTARAASRRLSLLILNCLKRM